MSNSTIGETREQQLERLHAQACDALDRAHNRITELETKLTKEREAVARFLVPYRSHLPESWLQHFEDSGIVTFDTIGFVKAAKL